MPAAEAGGSREDLQPAPRERDRLVVGKHAGRVLRRQQKRIRGQHRLARGLVQIGEFRGDFCGLVAMASQQRGGDRLAQRDASR